jgi:hypothetical protein
MTAVKSFITLGPDGGGEVDSAPERLVFGHEDDVTLLRPPGVYDVIKPAFLPVLVPLSLYTLSPIDKQ